jgi:uncharacterized protein (TIGR02147 family)
MGDIFTFKHYIEVVEEMIERSHEVRGYRGKLSIAAGTHSSYFSRVLSQEVHLTPDQAAGLCDFWGFSEIETDYFLMLVNYERAGTQILKKILKEKIDRIRQQQENLSKHIEAIKIPILNENQYYSAWYYSAVHLLLMIPRFQTVRTIAQKLLLSESKTLSILLELQNLKLVKKINNNCWQATVNHLHMDKSSWLAKVHHAGWRNKSIEQIQIDDPNNLHYTGVHTLSNEDFEKIRSILYKSLVEIDGVVRPSKEEELCVLGLDWFKF